MNELALFAGAGGGLLGSILLGHRTVCAVEIEPYCRKILLRRQRDGLLPLFPIWDDVKTFDGTAWRGRVDCVTAGFPCQPFSVAGQRKADADERNLWPDTARIIGEVRPRFAFLENVPGLIAHPYYGTVLGDLAALGYDAEWCVLGAGAIGATHQRERLWILAHSCKSGLATDLLEKGRAAGSRYEGNGERIGRLCKPSRRSSGYLDEGNEIVEKASPWRNASDQSPLVGISHGVGSRMERIRAIGNGQVPAVVAAAWGLLMSRIADADRRAAGKS